MTYLHEEQDFFNVEEQCSTSPSQVYIKVFPMLTSQNNFDDRLLIAGDMIIEDGHYSVSFKASDGFYHTFCRGVTTAKDVEDGAWVPLKIIGRIQDTERIDILVCDTDEDKVVKYVRPT